MRIFLVVYSLKLRRGLDSCVSVVQSLWKFISVREEYLTIKIIRKQIRFQKCWKLRLMSMVTSSLSVCWLIYLVLTTGCDNVYCICTRTETGEFVYPFLSFLLRLNNVRERLFAEEYSLDKSKLGGCRW